MYILKWTKKKSESYKRVERKFIIDILTELIKKDKIVLLKIFSLFQ